MSRTPIIPDKDEAEPLLKNPSKQKNTSSHSLSSGLAVASYLTAGIPLSVLNALAALAKGNPSKANNLQTPSDLWELIKSTDTPHLVFAAVIFLGSEATAYHLNEKFLLPSIKTVLNVFRRNTLTIKNLFEEANLPPKDKITLLENILFVWAIATSLIFAEVGKKALSFLGRPGEIAGFILNLLVFFATRYTGAQILVTKKRDQNTQLKEHYIEKLTPLNKDNNAISIVVIGDDTNQALVTFLTQVNTDWDNLEKDNIYIALVQYIAPRLGYPLTAIAIIPILFGYMPSAVQGLEEMTHHNITKGSHYQNPESFGFGIPAVALTLLFYALSISSLPEHVIKTILSAKKEASKGNRATVVKLIALTLLAPFLGYAGGGIGFQWVASIALAEGYYSYLGKVLSAMIPDGLLASVTVMLWSHLQEAISEAASTVQPVNPAGVTTVDAKNTMALLHHPAVDISALDAKNATPNEHLTLNP